MTKHTLTVQIEAPTIKEAEDKLCIVMSMLSWLHKLDKSSLMGNAVKLWILWEHIHLASKPKVVPHQPAAK
ncbi:hypothetical protein [Chitinophaga polysaccharea]|uniref:hypothetical protein n=1 Tax=Chitinophaga polysaccharea TaxID=1293035 RepID=UPI00115C26F9|nr:hypothetical protein [Chitinophaga polysaccharea]